MKKIATELEAEILRLYVNEHWKIGTIATQLGTHHETVERVLKENGHLGQPSPADEQCPRPTATTLLSRPSIVDPYAPFVTETLREYPRLPSSRLYHMLKERGYQGSESHLRRVVSCLRPRPKAEAYLRLRTLPGEQAQVDWGHFGSIRVGKAIRPLWAFVMVLSYSRAIFLRFFLSARMPNFLHGHVEAFTAWGGVPRVLLYDNLKSAVLERHGDSIRFHPTLLEIAKHYGFAPRPVAPGRGNEKGRVERAIRYARTNFWTAREYADVVDLNRQAQEWTTGPVLDRRWPDDRQNTVQDALIEEKPYLLALPDNPFPCTETLTVSVGKTPYVRFDRNDYSVPHTQVRRQLVSVASDHEVAILSGTETLCTHVRSYSSGERIEDPRHIADLVVEKRAARAHRHTDRLALACPSAQLFLNRVAERGSPLSRAVRQLGRLLDEFGQVQLEKAIAVALERDVADVPALQQILEQWRHAEGLPPPLPVHLPNDERITNLVVTPHSLDAYDNVDEDSDAEEKETTD